MRIASLQPSFDVLPATTNSILLVNKSSHIVRKIVPTFLLVRRANKNKSIDSFAINKLATDRNKKTRYSSNERANSCAIYLYHSLPPTSSEIKLPASQEKQNMWTLMDDVDLPIRVRPVVNEAIKALTGFSFFFFNTRRKKTLQCWHRCPIQKLLTCRHSFVFSNHPQFFFIIKKKKKTSDSVNRIGKSAPFLHGIIVQQRISAPLASRHSSPRWYPKKVHTRAACHILGCGWI